MDRTGQDNLGGSKQQVTMTREKNGCVMYQSIKVSEHWARNLGGYMEENVYALWRLWGRGQLKMT